MRKIYLAAFVLGVILGSLIEIHSQTFDEQQTSQEIAALFNKTKHKVKEKRGIKIENFVDIKSKPAVKQSSIPQKWTRARDSRLTNYFTS